MIFVAVGTQKFPLNRLLEQIDALIASGSITEPVFAQIGYATYEPKHFEFQTFLNKEAFDQKISECDLLLTHAGVGTIVAGMKHKKPVVLFPRLAQFGEHVDDHQMEIARSFAEQNFVALCLHNDNLLEVISEARTHHFDEYHSQQSVVVETIRSYLAAI